MGFGNNNHVVDIWYRNHFWLYKTTPEIKILTYQQVYNTHEITNVSYRFPFQIATISNFLTSAPTFGCTGSGSHTREAVAGNVDNWRGRSKEMDCHYLDSWSVQRRGVCKSWLVMMHQLNSVVSEIFCHVPSRLVHSFKHAPEITGPTAVATVVMRHSDNCATGDGSSFCTHRSFNWSNVKSLQQLYFSCKQRPFNLL